MKKNLNTLSVDLDGTLIKSDMLHETFWSSFAKDPLIPLKAINFILKGKANLKKFLYEKSSLDISSLPYNEIVIKYINLHRSRGGKVALVTGSTQKLAEDISKHLNLFDEVYGSSSNKNLVGTAKANLQKKIFGIKNFDYIGNSFADIQSWKLSDKAITLNASKSLKKKSELINENYYHLINEDNPSFLKSFIKEIRPQQWIKNILLFIPIIAAQSFDIFSLFTTLIAFISFSFTSSSVYIINDLLDIKADRKHPKKCKRPLAAGDLSFNSGFLGSLVLILLGSIFGLAIGTSFLKILFAYFFITLSYSIYFKKKALLDIFILSGLYTIRIISGGLANSLEISYWLLAFSIFIFLSLAAIKRETELIDLIDRGKTKIENRDYRSSDLNFIKNISISSGMISVLLLALYINSPNVLNLYSHPKFLWLASGLFFFWIIRVCFKTDRGEMYYDPVVFALKDKISIFIFLGIILFVVFATI